MLGPGGDGGQWRSTVGLCGRHSTSRLFASPRAVVLVFLILWRVCRRPTGAITSWSVCSRAMHTRSCYYCYNHVGGFADARQCQCHAMLWDDFDGSIGAQGFRETPSLKASPLLSDAGAIRLMAFSLLGCRIKHCSSSSPPAQHRDISARDIRMICASGRPISHCIQLLHLSVSAAKRALTAPPRSSRHLAAYHCRTCRSRMLSGMPLNARCFSFAMKYWISDNHVRRPIGP